MLGDGFVDKSDAPVEMFGKYCTMNQGVVHLIDPSVSIHRPRGEMCGETLILNTRETNTGGIRIHLSWGPGLGCVVLFLRDFLIFINGSVNDNE